MDTNKSSGSFNLLYFAAASSYTKKSSEPIKAPLRASDLFETLEDLYPGIKDKVLSSCAVTLNLEYIDLDEVEKNKDMIFKEGDEVAIIPPVSSG
jgi:molybdopterin converting factor small subunit